MFLYPLLFSLLVWLLVIIMYYLKTKKIRTHHFPFSERNYYIMLSGALIGLLVTVLYTNNFQLLWLFIVFGIAGVIGESIFSLWWHVFFFKRFWEYEVDTLFNSYTSFLNFIPWGIGGMLYLELTSWVLPLSDVRTIFSRVDVSWSVFIILIGGLILQSLVLLFYRRRNKELLFHSVSPKNYLFFFGPWTILLLYYIFLIDIRLLPVTILFASIPTLAEYLYGKATEFLISKKMWIYSYNSYDRGHFTPLAFPIFIIAGYYFLIVYSIFLSLSK